MIAARYLGDGVYASFDGFNIWLGLEADQELIALEPSVFVALMAYGRDLRDALNAKHAHDEQSAAEKPGDVT